MIFTAKYKTLDGNDFGFSPLDIRFFTIYFFLFSNFFDHH